MRILQVIVVVLVLFAAFVASRPSHFRVERSATMAAQPTVVQAKLEDFHAWKDWSPWEKLDPAMKTDFSGAPTGVGASYHWVGNDKVGEGRMTITESQPGQKTGIRLEFIKPFASVSQTTFTLTPQNGGTNVSWAMEGENNFVGKFFCLFMDMDKTVGADFQKGLGQLKTVAESAPPALPDSTTAPADTSHAHV